jgi:ketosteroid isomerase-like protein
VTPSTEPATREWIDQNAIRAILEQYFNRIDARDHARVASCFTADAYLEYTIDLEGKQRIVGSFEEWQAYRDTAPEFTATNHSLSNTWIDLQGDEADSTSFAVCHLLRGPAAGGRVFVRGLRYRDRFRREGHAWRIAHRVHDTLWQYEMSTVPAMVAPADGERGHR